MDVKLLAAAHGSTRSPRAARAPRAASLRAPAAASRRAPARSDSVRQRPVDDVSEQRIYHLTHINNLAAIVATGALLADASGAWTSRPSVDISADNSRLSRRATPIVGENDVSVAHFVPFFLSPNSTVWDSIRSNSSDPRLAVGTSEAAASDFIILVSTVKHAIASRASASGEDAGVDATDDTVAIVVADGDAAHVLTRFGGSGDAAERMLRKLRAEDLAVTILDAEYLVRESFPIEYLTLIGVANDRVRDAVKAILRSTTHHPKVAVYPPWFQPTGALTE